MRYLTSLSIKAAWLALLLIACLCVNTHAADSGNNSGPAASKEPSSPGLNGKLDFQTDLFTGRFGYGVPIVVPPGRNGTEPSLRLRYTSGNDNSWCGLGWDLEVGHIQRETRKGVPVAWSGSGTPLAQYDDGKGFVYNFNGFSGKLVNVAGNEFRAEIDTEFLRFNYMTNSGGNYWMVTDKSGNKYFFGEAANSRMVNSKSSWASVTNQAAGTFRWAMNRAQTINGSTNQITYTNISGSLYPAQILYNGHTNGIAPNNSVQFVLQSRTDVRSAYYSGYQVLSSQLLSKIYCKLGTNVVRRYDLTYTNSPSTTRSLLSSVTINGLNETNSLPPITFSYQQQARQFQSVNWTNLATTWPNTSPPWTTPTADDGAGGILSDLADMDGDGLPDRLMRRPDSTHTNYFFQRNTGSGFASLETNRWGPLTVQTSINGTIGAAAWDYVNGTRDRLLDINGDGYPDHVLDPIEAFFNTPNNRFTNFVVDLNNGANFVASNLWPNVSAPFQSGSPSTSDLKAIENGSYVRLIDMNGDGLPDRVLQHTDTTFTQTNWWVQFNTGSGFGNTNYWVVISDQGAGTGTPLWWAIDSDRTKLIDINGDGLPDRVMAPKASGSSGIDQNNFNRFVVQFNNGYGFENAVDWTNVNFKADLPNGFSSTAWSSIEQEPDGFSSNGTALRDVNGDGLPDRILGKYTSPYTNYFVQFNTGATFTTNLYVWGPPNAQGQTTDPTWSWIEMGNNIRFIDMNGDGLPDRVMTVYPGTDTSKTWFVVDVSAGPLPDLLTNVNNGIGGSVAVTYKSSTSYNNHQTTNVTSAGLLAMPVYTVSSAAVSDGMYPAYTNSYGYDGGYYDFSRREFAGFATVSVTNALGEVTRNYFHQGGGRDNSALGEFDDPGKFSKRGLAYRVELVGTNSQLYKLTLNKVQEYSFGANGRRFPFVAQTIDEDYPGTGGPYRATARQFTFDTTSGNLTNTLELGEVTNVDVSNQAATNLVTTDDVYQITLFASLSNPDILDKPSTAWVSDDAAGSSTLRETLYAYDGNTGNLLQNRSRICAGSYLTNLFAYDGYGNMYLATNEAGIVTTTYYESAKTFPNQQVTAAFTSYFTYDLNSGALIQTIDPKGLVRSNVYDGFYRVLSTWVSDTPNVTPNVWLERYSYTLGGVGGSTAKTSTNYVRLEKNDTTSANPSSGHVAFTYFDGLGRVIQIRDQSETSDNYRVSQKAYNEWGALKVGTMPMVLSGTNYTALTTNGVNSTYHEYDPVGRPIKSTIAMGANFSNGLLSGTPTQLTESGSSIGPLQIAYNDGNEPWTIVVTDEAGSVSGLVRKFLLDGFGRTNKIVDVFNGSNYATNTLVYDKLDQVTNVIDAANNKIEYAYNDLGQTVAMADPDLGFWQYQRDYAGRLRNQIDAKGQKIILDYNDPLGRLKTRSVYDGSSNFLYTVNYAYDTGIGGYTVYNGQLASVTDNQGTSRFSYDVRGRTLKSFRQLSVNNQSYTNQFTYDSADRTASISYTTGGPTVTNLYDGGGHLVTVQRVDGTNVYYQSSGFNEANQLLGIGLGNGVNTTYGYYPYTKRLQSIATKLGTAATNLQSLSYAFNQVADLTSITDNIYASGTNSATLSSIGYDNLHRLTSLTRPGPATTSFAYNPIGNVTTNGEEGGSTYTYPSSGLFPHGVRLVGAKQCAYDLCGNMVFRNGQSLGYDAENRLSTVARSGAAVATFGYDNDGERLWKQGTNTLYVWIGNLFESWGTTNLYHIFAGTRRVATYSPATKLPGASGNTDYHYYHPDHLGSSSLLTDNTGAVAEHYEYTAYGRERANGAAAPDETHRFTGQVFDQDTGLHYYGARYYDQDLGRFVQPDTVIPSLWNPQSYNRYAYSLNNPLRYTDPTGHGPLDFIGSFFDYSGPTYLAPGPNARATYGPPSPSNISLASSQASMRRQMLGDDAWDTGGLQLIREGVATAAKMNPIYLAHEAVSGLDSTEPNRQLTIGDRVESGIQAGMSGLPVVAGAVKTGAALVKSEKAVTKDLIRIRHYTNSKGLNGIQEEGVIRASDQNRVFAESARRKPLSPKEAEDTYGLNPGRGRNYVETDVPASRVSQRYNPDTHSKELVVKGDVQLQNPTFEKRK